MVYELIYFDGRLGKPTRIKKERFTDLKRCLIHGTDALYRGTALSFTIQSDGNDFAYGSVFQHLGITVVEVSYVNRETTR